MSKKYIIVLVIIVYLFSGIAGSVIAEAAQTGGVTIYKNLTGYYDITVKKGNSTSVFRITCSVANNNHAGSQRINYTINRRSGTGLGVTIDSGTTYNTQADDYAGKDGWTSNERQYILPIKLNFSNQTGYTLGFSSNDSSVVSGAAGIQMNLTITGNVADLKTTANGTGMTDWGL